MMQFPFQLTELIPPPSAAKLNDEIAQTRCLDFQNSSSVSRHSADSAFVDNQGCCTHSSRVTRKINYGAVTLYRLRSSSILGRDRVQPVYRSTIKAEQQRQRHISDRDAPSGVLAANLGATFKCRVTRSRIIVLAIHSFRLLLCKCTAGEAPPLRALAESAGWAAVNPSATGPYILFKTDHSGAYLETLSCLCAGEKKV
ncbi:hypothetical protein J6590_036105 [Homalodisca vitripennis]|nr:hypothetical protein J6590_036105 [Homalodisca vitripennis]